ncbi:hypothetical protein BASA60_007223 [Batrachochytrium salamandrivorans]|nr:hypothetical protein BASA60_007223 [Batrachochytrium salamandrivorans]
MTMAMTVTTTPMMTMTIVMMMNNDNDSRSNNDSHHFSRNILSTIFKDMSISLNSELADFNIQFKDSMRAMQFTLGNTTRTGTLIPNPISIPATNIHFEAAMDVNASGLVKPAVQCVWTNAKDTDATQSSALVGNVNSIEGRGRTSDAVGITRSTTTDTCPTSDIYFTAGFVPSTGFVSISWIYSIY